MSKMWGEYEDRKKICYSDCEGKLMKKTDPFEVYFMKKFKELGIKVVPPMKEKRVKRHH